MRRFILPISGLLLVIATSVGGQGRPAISRKGESSNGSAATLDDAFRSFWATEDARSAEKAAQEIARGGALSDPESSGPERFDGVLARLRDGRPYRREATGVREMPTTVAGTRLDNNVEIPSNYDPAKKWTLRVQLHGGVGRNAPGPGQPAPRPLTPNRIPGESEIQLQPRAWANSEWWMGNQVDNVLELVDGVKRRYNIDESRVYITGISDGGTGVYFFALRVATAWSACLPLNGHPSVLANPDVGADGDLFVGNLVNCPLYLVNGGKDPLYPASSVAPLVDLMKRAGASVLFHVYPDAAHNTNWWPEERARYEAFIATHARAAHPAKISWETERTDRYNRFRWVVIDALGTRPSDVALEDVNSFEPVPGVQRRLYEHLRPSGRVDISRRDNAFESQTRGVREFTLLLSPDVIDFSRPVHVTVNGHTAFDGLVKRDVATLLKWAARDNDRTMLYAAELKVAVP